MKKFSVLFLVSLLFIGCGDDSETAPNSEDTGAESDSSASDISAPEDTTQEIDSTQEEDVAIEGGPLAAVPPEALGGDPSLACPDTFANVSLSAGQHAGFTSGEQERSFHLLTPDASAFEGPRPIIVAFNGTGGNGQGAMASYHIQTFVDAGFIAVGPDSNGNGSIWPSWDGMHQAGEEEYPNPDLDFFDDLLACVAAHLEVDRHRIYVMGLSSGGIMTNYVLQRRSEILAGGIVASGILDFTHPATETPLDPMAVAVVWGGDNDEYSGDSESEDVAVPKVNFVEQAALASELYSEADGVEQIWCRSNDIGHAWNELLNAYLMDFLLAHPKGYADNPDWAFEQVDEASNAVCGDEIYAFDSGIDIPCSGEGACFEYCDFSAQCAAENATVAPIIAEQLMDLGFVGDDAEKCDGCINACEEDLITGGAVDDAVLVCIAETGDIDQCGPGIEGAFPYINTMDACCLDALDSAICTRLCDSLQKNGIVLQFFPSCSAWTPEEAEETEGGGEETDGGEEG